MGDLDLVKPILEKEGKVHFGRVLMKPGECVCMYEYLWFFFCMCLSDCMLCM